MKTLLSIRIRSTLIYLFFFKSNIENDNITELFDRILVKLDFIYFFEAFHWRPLVMGGGKRTIRGKNQSFGRFSQLSYISKTTPDQEYSVHFRWS